MSTLLAIQPRRRYLKGRGALEIAGYPWLTLGAVQALELIVRPEHAVLELGSGGSTVFFARRAARVRSLETDPVWAGYMDTVLRLSEASNVRLTCASLRATAADLAAEPDGSYDLVLIDHRDPRRTGRPLMRLPLALAALPKLKAGGWLVVDNYAICGMQRLDTRGWDVWTFDDLDWPGRGTRLMRRLP